MSLYLKIHFFYIFISLQIIYTFGTRHEKQFHGHSPLSVEHINCDTMRFRSMEDRCGRTNARYPMKGSCTKFIHCIRNQEDELVPSEIECSDGTVFHPRKKTCVLAGSETCPQVKCDNGQHTKHRENSKTGAASRRQYTSTKPAESRPIDPCSDDKQNLEDEEELEWGAIPKVCPPTKHDDSAPQQSNQFENPHLRTKPNPSEAYGPTPPGIPPRNYEQAPSSRLGGTSWNQGSSGYGNREAGRVEAQGYYGNREAGRPDFRDRGGFNGNRQNEQGSTEYYFYTNKPSESTTSSYNKGWDPDKYTTQRPTGYPAFPGQEQTVPTTKKPIIQEHDHEHEEDFTKDQKPNEGQGIDQTESELPSHASQHQSQNGCDKIKVGLGVHLFVILMFLA